MSRNQIETLFLLAIPCLLAACCVSCGSHPMQSDFDPTENVGEFVLDPDEFVPVEQFPVRTYYEEPVYPLFAHNAGLEGTVWVSALILTNGRVSAAIIKKSSGHQPFDDSALQAAYLCRYTPALQNGRPVNYWVTYKVEFKLL